jgi:class 3 adenylate cyclase
VVTFLFTDVEGSTRRWEADAQAMRAALVVHDKVLRTAIEAYDGFLFSHTGDGFVAAFASPMSAVNAAIDAQRELQLPVRMGLATGEAELRDGDYFGTVLNRAARVMAAGHGGQILLAESTAGLLSGVDLLDLGPRRLRDVRTRSGCSRYEQPPPSQPESDTGTGSASHRGVAVAASALPAGHRVTVIDAGLDVHAVLVRCRLNRLSHIDIRTGEVIRRYERAHPGAMLHVW